MKTPWMGRDDDGVFCHHRSHHQEGEHFASFRNWHVNTLTQALANVCREHLLREKWLIAPSRRIGHQWLDSIAFGGQSAVNVHMKTLRSMAVDLASPAMLEQQVTLVSRQEALFLIDHVLRTLPEKCLKYLASAISSKGMAETVLSSIEAVRLAGLDVCHLEANGLEVPAKIKDLSTIAREYLKRLVDERLIDYRAALEIAMERLTNEPDCLGEETILLLPEDMRLGAREQQLLETIPIGRRYLLPIDRPANPSSTKNAQSDLDRLRWFEMPADVPEPIGDGSVEMIRAIGEVNEVRGVMRRCLADEICLDQVEILHAEAETYVPLIYECISVLERSGGDSGEELPVTFAEGIPSGYSRPGRALSIWLAWIGDGFPQETLVKMIREGLLQLPKGESEHSGFHRLAALFRSIGIGIGRDRYMPKIDERIECLQAELKVDSQTNDEEKIRQVTRLRCELRDMQVLHSVVRHVLELASGPQAAATEVLAGARQFVATLARRVSKLDQFATVALVGEIQSLENWFAGEDGDIGVEVWPWLSNLPQQIRVLGSGPRPGKLHVDNLYSGGQSGRRHTFIVGLDDSRFPGAGLQDPILLDNDRRKLSTKIPTSVRRLEETTEDFIRLLARLRGQLTLCFSCQNVVDDREMFPSSALLATFRVLSGDVDADQSDLLAALDQPISFAPATLEQALDVGEWWLGRLCGPVTIDQPRRLVHRHFPHLAQGHHASQCRQSDDFTVYDGCVPAAGKFLDPTVENGRKVSASGLQTLGSCPLRFFYRYGLRMKLPDEVIVDPLRWLDPLAFGTLLHQLFEKFLRELLQEEKLPQFDRDHSRLETLLVKKIAEYEDRFPPSSQVALQSQSGELRQAAETFLREEERFCRETGSQPVYLEASLGLPSEGYSTPLDTADPISIVLPNGKQIRTHGRIDRIDKIAGGAIETYAVWDYKTGSTYGYERANPFRQGRLMQPLLYISIVSHRLRETVSPQARVANFGFFFPSSRAAGQRVNWTSSELQAGMGILEKLCQVIQEGLFLPTNDFLTDCTYCDYQTVCGDVQAISESSQRKLDNNKNRLLKPLRDLRTDA